MKTTNLFLKILLAIYFIIMFIPIKGYGTSVCNVHNDSREDFRFPYAGATVIVILMIYHMVSIVTVNKDFLKISDADRPYKKAVKKEGDKASKVFDMGDFLKHQKRSYKRTEICLVILQLIILLLGISFIIFEEENIFRCIGYGAQVHINEKKEVRVFLL